MKQIHTARQMAREEAYELPMMIGGEQSSVSVRIIHNAAESGTVDITMEHITYGKMRARFSAQGNGDAQRLEGYVVCDSSDGVQAAEAQKDRLLQRFDEEGLAVAEMKFVYSEHMAVNFSEKTADENNSTFNTASLYRTAKTFLQVMGGES